MHGLPIKSMHDNRSITRICGSSFAMYIYTRTHCTLHACSILYMSVLNIIFIIYCHVRDRLKLVEWLIMLLFLSKCMVGHGFMQTLYQE